MKKTPRELLALILTTLLFLACDARQISWILVSTDAEGVAHKLWPEVAKQANALGMTCYEGPSSNSTMYSSLRTPIRSELFCDWSKDKRKMTLHAAYSDKDLLVYLPWDTTEFWFSKTEGRLLTQGLESRFRMMAPFAKIETCMDECDSSILHRPVK